MRYCGLFTLCFTVLSVVFGACGKREDVQTVSTYSFTNTLKENVTLNFYDSRQDYLTCGTLLSTYEVKPGATIAVPLQALKTYWLDWHSDSFAFNNWGDSLRRENTDGLPTPKLTVAGENDHLFIQASKRDSSRAILLNGNDPSSVWRITIDKEMVLNGTHTFMFQKDFSGQYIFTDPAGRSNTIPISFHVIPVALTTAETIDFQVIVANAQGGQIASMNFFANGGPTVSKGRDFMIVLFNALYKEYWAQRQ